MANGLRTSNIPLGNYIGEFLGHEIVGTTRSLRRYTRNQVLGPLDALTSGLQVGGGVTFTTKAQADGHLSYSAFQVAIVTSDPTSANNGIYQKTGTTGFGSWLRVADLPNELITLTVTGGTGDAITASLSPQTPSTPGTKLYLLTPTANNTGATTINGIAIKNAAGSTLAANSLISGSQVLMAWASDHYQLLISMPVDASGILADAISARDASSGYATAAASSASALGNQVHQYDTRALAIAATIPTGVQAIKITRYAAGYPLSYATYVQGTSAGPMAFRDNAGAGNWWELDISGGVCPIEWFGGRGDATVDNAPAFNAWFASLPAVGGCLRFGAGKFKFSSAIDKTMASGVRQSIEICGAAGDVTRLYWPDGGGLKISQANNLNSVHIHDLTITTGAVNTGVGLWLYSPGLDIGFTGSQSEVWNVNISGDDYTDQIANNCYWAQAFLGQGWSNITVNNLNTYGLIAPPGDPGGGRGVFYGGAGGISTSISGVIVFENCSFYFHEVGAELGDFWEDVTFKHCNFQGETGSAGVFCDVARVHAQYLSLLDSQFNSAGYQIALNAAIPKLVMIGNRIAVYANPLVGGVPATGTLSVGLSNLGDSPIIIGNEFDVTAGASNTVGISLSGVKGIVQGNIFTGFKAGVNLGAATSKINVSGNEYESCTTNVVNTGTGNHVGVITQ
jgi:hypothetical protein